MYIYCNEKQMGNVYSLTIFGQVVRLQKPGVKIPNTN